MPLFVDVRKKKTQTNISCCDLTGESVWTPVNQLMTIWSELSNFERGMMVVAMWIKHSISEITSDIWYPSMFGLTYIPPIRRERIASVNLKDRA